MRFRGVPIIDDYRPYCAAENYPWNLGRGYLSQIRLREVQPRARRCDAIGKECRMISIILLGA